MYEKRDILTEADRGVSTARNALARLFRQVLEEKRIDPSRWDHLMRRYLDDKRNGIPLNGKDRSSARGNLNKELRRPRMTFRVFVEKAIPFLNPFKVEFIIKLHWKNRTTGKVDISVHQVTMNREQLQDDIDAGIADGDDEE